MKTITISNKNSTLTIRANDIVATYRSDNILRIYTTYSTKPFEIKDYDTNINEYLEAIWEDNAD